jgi:hypothetical protein
MIDHKNHIKEYLKQQSSSKDFGLFKYLAIAGQLGIIMITSILICFFISRYLIMKFRLSDFWLVAGLILGIIGGMTGCYKLLKKMLRDDL